MVKMTERERCLAILAMHRKDFEQFEERLRRVDPSMAIGPAHVWIRVCNMIRSGEPPITLEEQLFDAEESDHGK